MGLKTYLITMLAGTILCWVSWVVALFTIDPDMTNHVGFLLFYCSLVLALLGSGAIFGFVIRFIFLKRQLVTRSVIDAFRQSSIFALLIVASLYLLSKDLFSWLNLFFLMAGLTTLEMFLVSYRRSR